MSFVPKYLRHLFLILVWPALLLVSASELWAQDITKAKKVLDGNTIVTQDGRVVRLIGILAPQPARGDRPGEYFAEESRAYLEKRLAGRSFQLTLENQNAAYKHRDKYGRLLAYLYLLPERTFLNRELVRAGMAFPYPPHYTRMMNDLIAEQYQAKTAKRGMWANLTESPLDVAQREKQPFEEPPFSYDPKAETEEPVSAKPDKPAATGAPVQTGEPDEPEKLPTLDATKAYAQVKVETCAVLDVTGLEKVALIGVRNQPGTGGGTARTEVEKLIRGKRLRFELDEKNVVRKHRDKAGNLLVYAYLPDGKLLNFQIIANGISDVDYDWNFSKKGQFLGARDEARVKGVGPYWQSSMVKLMNPEQLRVSLAKKMNDAMGASGGKCELLGDSKEVLRFSHDLMDRDSANSLFKALSVSRDLNLQALRGYGIREVQFTDMRVSNIYRFPIN